MPPRTRKPLEEPRDVSSPILPDDVIIRTDPDIMSTINVINESMNFIKVGDIVNVASHGRTLMNYEILGFNANFVKFRGDVSISPQTEVVLIPYAQIEAIGLVNER